MVYWTSVLGTLCCATTALLLFGHECYSDAHFTVFPNAFKLTYLATALNKVQSCEDNGNRVCSVSVLCKDIKIFKSILKSFNISIDLRAALQCRQSSAVIPFPEPKHIYQLVSNHVLLKVIAEIMHYWQRFKGIIITDHYDSDNELQEAYKVLRAKSLEVEILPFHLISDMKDIFQGYENFIIHCTEAATISILMFANHEGLFGGTHTWIVVGRRIPEVLKSIKIGQGSFVTFLKPTSDISKPHRRDCILPIFANFQTFTAKKPNEYNGEFCNENIQKRMVIVHPVPGDRQISSFGRVNTVDIMDVFHSTTTNQMESVRFATWDHFKGLFMLEFLDPNDQKDRLKGKMMQGVVFEHKPYTYVEKRNGTTYVTGYVKEIIDMLMDTLNISYTLREMEPVYGIGIHGNNTGFVGMLYRKEADMSLNVLAMTRERQLGVRYAGPLTKGFLAICYNRPEAIVPPTAYLLPLDGFAWITTFGVVVVTIGVLAIVLFNSPESKRLDTPSKDVHSTAFRIFTGTFFEEVFETTPGASAKIVFGVLLVTTMVVFIHYTSVFTAFLTHLELTVPFDNLEGVIENRAYSIVYIREARHHAAFKNADRGIYHRVWQKIESDKRTAWALKWDQGLYLMYTGQYVYLADGPTTYYLTSDICNVSFASKIYMNEYLNLATRLDFPYTRILALGKNFDFLQKAF